MKEPRDLISIIVRTRNMNTGLCDTLASVRNQHYRPLQVLLVHKDCTPLQTDILQEILADVSLHQISVDNGVTNAGSGNAGIGEAQGKYVCFLDEDKEYDPDHLEQLSDLLQQGQNMVAYSKSSDSNRLADLFPPQNGKYDVSRFSEQMFALDAILTDNPVPLSNMLFDRRILELTGGFDESFEMFEDWDLIIRCGYKNPFVHLNKETLRYRPSSCRSLHQQLSENTIAAEQGFRRILQKHGEKFGPILLRIMSRYELENLRLEEEITKKREYAANIVATCEGAIKQMQGQLDESRRINRGLTERSQMLNDILSSKGWKLLLLCYRTMSRLFPEGSRRRGGVQLLSMMLVEPRRVVNACRKENLQKFFSQLGHVDLRTLLERIQRKVALQEQFCLHSTFQTVSGEEVFMESVDHLLPPADKNGFLVVDRGLPTYDKDSGGLRMLHIIELLVELGYRVTFIADDEQKIPVYEAKLASLGIHVVCENVEEYLREHGGSFSYVMLSRPEQAYSYLPLIRAYAVYSQVLYDTVDLHWIRFLRGAAVENDTSLITRAAEYKKMELLNSACSDIVLTVTEDERKSLLEQDKDLNVAVLPNIHDVVNTIPPYRDRRNLMFIGGFQHQPNEDAMVYFVKEIFPVVSSRLNGVKLYIVGSNPSETVLSLASDFVLVTGFVDDAIPYFEKCRVFVSPLRYGAGMKGKIGQSMSCGLPVVTSTIGAEGIGLINGENALIADEKESFAQAVVELYENEQLWQNISKNGYDYIVRNFSKKVTKVRLEKILSTMVRP